MSVWEVPSFRGMFARTVPRYHSNCSLPTSLPNPEAVAARRGWQDIYFLNIGLCHFYLGSDTFRNAVNNTQKKCYHTAVLKQTLIFIL